MPVFFVSSSISLVYSLSKSTGSAHLEQKFIVGPIISEHLLHFSLFNLYSVVFILFDEILVRKRITTPRLQIYKQSSDLFRKYGVLRSETFELNSTETYDDMRLTNIANTLSTSQDEEVWLELQYYRDRKHLDEVRAKCGNDENMGRLYKQSLDLLTR